MPFLPSSGHHPLLRRISISVESDLMLIDSLSPLNLIIHTSIIFTTPTDLELCFCFSDPTDAGRISTLMC